MTIPTGQTILEVETRLLRRVAEESPDAFILISSDGTIHHANPASGPLLCCWDRRVGDIVPDDWNHLVASSFASNESREIETECEGMTFSFHVVPVIDHGYVFFYGRDITERKQTEEELRISEQRFALVMRGTNDGIWDYDLRNGEIHYSQRWKEMLGYHEDQVENHFSAWQDMIHPDDLGELLDVWTDCMEGLTPSFSAEYRMQTSYGDWIWVECRGLAMQDEDNTPVRLAGSHSDITERKQAEEALFHEKELAEITLHSIGDAVVTTDIRGHIEYMNPVAEKLTGWPLDEAKGRPSLEILNLINEKNGEPAEDPVKKCLAEDRTVDLAGHAVLISRDGTEFAIEDSVAPIRDRGQNIIGVVIVFDNVSEERQLKNQLTWQASHDGLTGLYNRTEFERRLEIIISEANADHTENALLYLDLDQFKVINDTCGHVAGDILLKHLAKILENKVRDTDTVARLGGDEFGVLLAKCPMQQAKNIANGIREAIAEFQFCWEEKTFEVGVSVGIVCINDTAGTRNDLLSAADLACYKAKDLGRNRVCVYEDGDADLVRRHGEMQWVTIINDSLKESRFRLYYQAIVPYTSTDTEGEHYEILLRMLDESDNLVPPIDFMPAAERYNLMPAIDRWVIRETFATLGIQPHALDNLSTCCINLAGESLGDDDLISYIREQFEIYNVPPEVICFEITETTAIANLSQATNLINELKALGCRFALDDFGSGLSSFGYLKTLPVDYLKIDGTFVRDMVDNPVDCAMVKSINEVGHAMGKKTIAEWAEDEATLAQLKEIGVDYAQGYAIDRPRPFMLPPRLYSAPVSPTSESLTDEEMPGVVIKKTG